MLIIVKRGGILFAALMVIVAFLIFTLRPAEAEELPKTEKAVIVIDPGHGAPDGGAVGTNTGVLEKDLNLSISKLLAEKLSEKGETVLLTREDDRGLYTEEKTSVRAKKQEDMRKRVSIANQNGVSCLISIHMNFFTDSRYSGPQIFYPADSEESRQLAEEIRLSILQSIGPHCTREIKPTKDLFLLRKAEVPAVIVECGFLSSPEEEALLVDSAYQERMAAAISEGIINYGKSNIFS